MNSRPQLNFSFHDPFPARTVKELVYKDYQSHNSGGSNQQAGTAIVYNLNSLFLPVAGGHQPFGFDQMATLYQRYRVNKVRVKVESYQNSGVLALGAQVIAVLPPGSTTTTTGLLTAFAFGENYNGSTQTMVPYTRPTVFEATYDIATIVGLTKKELEANIEDYSALVSASPTRIPFMEVNCVNIGAIATCSHVVTITYFCEFWQRVSLAQS